ncbi:MAG: DUF5060 domain-containing protein, partial [Akkermansiaceae bacterium]|nr:DUF5060 domain-containing protein [Akkermansiaceae bacterium]
WGEPPAVQTTDHVALPGGYGHGSSTLKAWIQKNLAADAIRQPRPSGVAKRQRTPGFHGPRGPDGDGSVTIRGELKQWHKVTLDLSGPYAHELDRDPNPFTDYYFQVVFRHESGSPDYAVPGYFAADGRAAESSADKGNVWRAHLSPDKPGKWSYRVIFLHGPRDIGLLTRLPNSPSEKRFAPFDGVEGSFVVAPNDKSGRDFRAHGRLTYTGNHYLQFSGSRKIFLKAGADAPETLLAYAGFDNTTARKKAAPLKTWAPHVRDWAPGDPSWQDGKGKGLIGALNYLASKGVNAFSFLPYNAGGDGDNVWPFAAYGEKFHYDCSKLDQWGIVFDHATAQGLYLHFKLQETENDDRNRGGHKGDRMADVPAALDGGDLGPERKLYCRELVARFGHNLALNWNLGEENTQTSRQQLDMAEYIRAVDPYDHHIVVHTYPNMHDKVYGALLGKKVITGISMQNSDVRDCHHQVVKWVKRSRDVGHPWVVAFDEPGDAKLGMPPDPGYPGMPGDYKGPTIHDIRKYALWGTLMAGGGGVEYYFGYELPQNDLVCEDWRSRDKSWDYCRIALEFFDREKIPFWELINFDELVGNPGRENTSYCLAKRGLYLVYLPEGKSRPLLPVAGDTVTTIQWFNPRNGELSAPSPVTMTNSRVALEAPDGNDWLAIVK